MSLAEEHKFIFTNIAPKKSPAFLLSTEIIKKPGKIIEITVNIPGLPKIENMNFLYCDYFGKVPSGWHGATIFWHDEGNYWPVNVHMALSQDADIYTRHHEAYHVGFLAALSKAGVDLEKIDCLDGRELAFMMNGSEWSFTQLGELIAEIGSIRIAKKNGKPGATLARFEETLRMPKEYDALYALTKHLIILSEKDPDRYVEYVGKLMDSFLKIAPKKT